MGAFTNLFKIGERQIPRVAILEAFAENPDDSLSASDIIRITGVSRRAVYLILNDLVEDGLLVLDDKPGNRGAKQFYLNPNDARASNLALIESILNVGSIESRIKEDANIPQSDALPPSVMVARVISGQQLRRCGRPVDVRMEANALERKRLRNATTAEHAD